MTRGRWHAHTPSNVDGAHHDTRWSKRLKLATCATNKFSTFTFREGDSRGIPCRSEASAVRQVATMFGVSVPTLHFHYSTGRKRTVSSTRMPCSAICEWRGKPE
jgi:hypothetical protein